jgi:hypothetical protein
VSPAENIQSNLHVNQFILSIGQKIVKYMLQRLFWTIVDTLTKFCHFGLILLNFAKLYVNLVIFYIWVFADDLCKGG